MDSKFIAGALIIAIAISGGSFYAGMHYAQSSRAGRLAQGGNAQFFQTGAGGARQGTRFTGGNGAFGTILSKDDSGITIQLMAPGGASSTQETGSKIVLVNGSTQINKTSSGTVDDLSVGESVTIQGTQNSDGSLTAQMIQIRPAGMGFRAQ